MQHETSVVASTTPAGGGEITPAPAGPATSNVLRSTAGAAGVVEPPTPEASPAAAGSDEIKVKELFVFPIDEIAEDPQITFSINSNGSLIIQTAFEGTLELDDAETRNLYKFLTRTSSVWSA